MKKKKQQGTKHKQSGILRQAYAVCALLSIIFFSINSLAANVNNPNDFIEKEVAVIRIINKASTRVTEHTLRVGQDFSFSKLGITVRACMTTQPFAAHDDFMFVEIAKDDRRIFSGWMTASAPGDNPLQDNEYDVWLVSCR